MVGKGQLKITSANASDVSLNPCILDLWYFLRFCYLCFLYSLANSCLNILTVAWHSYRYLRKHNLFIVAKLSPKSLRLLLVVISEGGNQQTCTHGKRNLQVGSWLCGLLNLFSRLFFCHCYSVGGWCQLFSKMISLLHRHRVSPMKCLPSDLCS